VAYVKVETLPDLCCGKVQKNLMPVTEKWLKRYFDDELGQPEV